MDQRHPEWTAGQITESSTGASGDGTIRRAELHGGALRSDHLTDGACRPACVQDKR
jgi:hypothetical protein